MSVYVDKAKTKYGRMVMCHMVADTAQELVAMIRRIGVSEKHLQHAGTYREHFDVCKSKRARAVALGAIEISDRELGAFLLKKKGSR